MYTPAEMVDGKCPTTIWVGGCGAVAGCGAAGCGVERSTGSEAAADFGAAPVAPDEAQAVNAANNSGAIMPKLPRRIIDLPSSSSRPVRGMRGHAREFAPRSG